ncbi:MAG: hypothetical protein FWE30_00315 [Bacteroidales bacterium]|nr:hypothetical protein [Bacteroidales bacterium]MCL2737872.1 hypothetical protein [Bacteroidales bacterium]
MKKLLVIVILPVLIIVLGYLIVDSISKPVRFNQEQKRRQAVAIERLKDIRTLQVAYKTQFGQFTDNLDTLLDFYYNGHISVIRQVGSWDDSLAVAQKRVFRETINIPVRDSLLKHSGFMIDSIRYIPFSGGKEFEMAAAIRTVSGVPVPLFEAVASFDYLLRGLDRQSIVNLKADFLDRTGTPGLRVGSVEAPNNNAGNWE